jgi:hypothetical protein
MRWTCAFEAPKPPMTKEPFNAPKTLPGRGAGKSTVSGKIRVLRRGNMRQFKWAVAVAAATSVLP